MQRAGQSACGAEHRSGSVGAAHACVPLLLCVWALYVTRHTKQAVQPWCFGTRMGQRAARLDGRCPRAKDVFSWNYVESDERAVATWLLTMGLPMQQRSRTSVESASPKLQAGEKLHLVAR